MPDIRRYAMIVNRKDGDVLAILDGSLSPGASVIVQNRSDKVPDPQLWLVGDDGTIESRFDGMVLDVLGSSARDGVPVIAFPGKRPATANQRWKLTDDGKIESKLGRFCLDIGTVKGQRRAVIADPDEDSKSQQWDLVPLFSLADVLAQPAKAFPAFTASDEAKSYKKLSKAASNGSTEDIRALYDSRSIDFGARINRLKEESRPDDVDKDTWRRVRDQLEDEFLRVSEVGKLFDNMRGFQTELSRQQSDRLDVLVDLSQPDPTTDLTWSIVDVIESLAISIIGEAQPEVAIVADVIKGVVGVAIEAGRVEESFTVTRGQIKEAFSRQMAAAFQGIELAATRVTTDWGRLKGTSDLILSSGPGSLRWPNQTSSELVAKALPGFDREVLRSVIPARFKVRRYLGVSSPDRIRSNFGDFARWHEDLGGGSFNVYVLAAGDAPPNERLMKDHLWEAGQDKPSFFLRQNGWSTPVQTDGDTPSNDIIVRIVNQSLTDISVTLSAVGSGLRGSATKKLDAIGGTGVWVRITSIFGERIDVSVKQSDGTDLGSFRINDEATVFLDEVKPARTFAFVLESSIPGLRATRTPAEAVISIRGG